MKGKNESRLEALRIPLSGRIVKALSDEDYILVSNLFQEAMMKLHGMPCHARTAGVERTYVRLVSLTALAAQVVGTADAVKRFDYLVVKLSEYYDVAVHAEKTAEAGLLRTVRSLVEMDVRRLDFEMMNNVHMLVRGLTESDVTAALNESGR
ncbi:MAG: hypothetical protein WC729_30085 [Sphingomonas sp.]|jgi:hypothetical protein|uniref:hypothetical protein n=1 Tax=Sphingomonas sp. TaxID=28214 RepID=UPI0035662C2F